MKMEGGPRPARPQEGVPGTRILIFRGPESEILIFGGPGAKILIFRGPGRFWRGSGEG